MGAGNFKKRPLRASTTDVDTIARVAVGSMGSHYIFTFQPTFTQGLLLGQFSILILLILILKYLFLDSTKHPFETSSYQPRPENNLTLRNRRHEQQNVVGERHDRHPESTEWLNALLQQVIPISVLSCFITDLDV
jgi:maintenance of morphology protein 1